ncbi:hypothetical protein BG004_003087, partial [Podila humilis]
METIIRRVLDQPTLSDTVKNAAITNLLAGTATLSTQDASLLLDLGLDLRAKSKTMLEIQNGDRILSALSTSHRGLFWARFPTSWLDQIVAITQS